jgi:hypothetical protein
MNQITRLLHVSFDTAAVPIAHQVSISAETSI